MRKASHAQIVHYMRGIGAPREIRAGLGDFDDTPYTETSVFNSPTGILGQVLPPELTAQYKNRMSFNLFPFQIDNTQGTNGSVSILPANERRTFLLVQNQSTSADLFVNFSGDAGLNMGLLLVPGVGVFFDIVCPYNAVAVYMDSATPEPGIVIEGAPQL